MRPCIYQIIFTIDTRLLSKSRDLTLKIAGVSREIFQKSRDVAGYVFDNAKRLKKIKYLLHYQNVTKSNQMPIIKYQCNDNLLHFGAMFWFRLKNIFKIVQITNSPVGCLCIMHILLCILQGKCTAGYNSRHFCLIFSRIYNSQKSQDAAKNTKSRGTRDYDRSLVFLVYLFYNVNTV